MKSLHFLSGHMESNYVSGRSQPFFQAGGSLGAAAPSYIPRSADNELYQALKEGEYCYVLTARQMGKSSLKNRTSDRLISEGFRTVTIDLTSVGRNVSAEQWYYGLLVHIGEQLNLEDELEDFWLENSRLGPLQRWIAAIDDVVLPQCPYEVVLFIDEVDYARKLEFNTTEFFAGIREFYNRRSEKPELKRLRFCLLGVAAPSDLIQDTRLTPFNIGKRIILTDFDREELMTLLPGLSTTLSQAQAQILINRIHYWTNGHPYLTQKLCRELAENSASQLSGDVDVLCSSLFLSAQAQLHEDNLVFVRDRLLDPRQDVASLMNLLVQIHKGKKIANEESNPLVSILRLSGIVPFNTQHLQIRNRIYQSVFNLGWARSNMPEAELRRIRKATNKVRLQIGGLAGIVIALLAGLAFWGIRAEGRARTSLSQALQARRDTENALHREKMNLVLAQQVGMRASIQAEELRTSKAILQNKTDELRKTANRLTKQNKVTENLLMETKRSQSLILKNRSELWQKDKLLTGEKKQAKLKQIQLKNLQFISSINQLSDWIKYGNIVKYRNVWNDVLNNKPGGADAFEYRLFKGIYSSYQLRHSTPGAILCCVVSPDKRWIALCKRDGRAYNTVILDARNRYRVHCVIKQSLPRLEYNLTQRNLKFSPDNKFFLAAHRESFTNNNNLVRLELQTKHLEYFSVPIHAQAIAFSPNRTTYALLGPERHRGLNYILEVRSTATNALLKTTTIPSPCHVMTFLSQDTLICGGTSDNLIVWKMNDASKPLTLVPLKSPKDHGFKLEAPLINIVLSPNKKYFAIATAGKIIVFNREALSVIRTFEMYSHLKDIEFDDNQNLIIVCSDKTVRILDIEQSGVKFDWFAPEDSICLSPFGKQVLIGTDEGQLIEWSPIKKSLTTIFAHGNMLFNVDISPNGKYFVSGGGDQKVRLWNAHTHKLISTLTFSEQVKSVSFSPDSTQIVVGGLNGLVTAWDVQTQKKLFQLSVNAQTVDQVQFSSDARHIICRGGNNFHLITQPNQLSRNFFINDTSSCTIFSPSGDKIVVGSFSKNIQVYSLKLEQIPLVFQESERAISIIFSLDGKYLISGHGDGHVIVWNFKTGKALKKFVGLGDVIRCMALSPEQTRLAVAGHTNDVMLFDIDLKEEPAVRYLLALPTEQGRVNSMKFTPDGNALVTGGDNGMIKVWSAPQ